MLRPLINWHRSRKNWLQYATLSTPTNHCRNRKVIHPQDKSGSYLRIRTVVDQTLLLITPPFTQLNTPYPATAYLKGFLQTKGKTAYQADLGIEVILALFSSAGLASMFAELEATDAELSDNSYRI